MRIARPLARSLLATAAVAAFAAVAGAQDSVSRGVRLASGDVVSRRCAAWLSAGVAVMKADARAAPPATDAFLARLGVLIARRFRYRYTDSTPLSAAFGARLEQSGAVADVRLLRGSGHAGFDLDGQWAASIAAGSPGLEAPPPAVPDEFTVLVSFGRAQDGRALFASHIACPPTPRPNEPAPKFPAATETRQRRSITTRFTVDSTGVVDSTTVTVLDQVSEVFVDASTAYVTKLRFLPAEFDGVREAASMTFVVTFVPPTDAESETP